MDSFDIFWDESASYILIYSVYALIVCSIIVYIENRLLQPDVALNKLIYSNASVLLLAVVMVTIGFFVTGWLYQYMGGEVVTFLVTVIISFLLLYGLKMFLINYFVLQFNSPIKISFYSSLILLVPYLLFNGFIFIVGSAFRN